jgi:hypothetical protein
VHLLAAREKDDNAHDFSARVSLDAYPEVVAIVHQETVLTVGAALERAPHVLLHPLSDVGKD